MFFVWLIKIISIIIMIPYLTLLERKILRYIQIRKGPNKVRLQGLLQPIRDGVKLLNKDAGSVFRAKIIIFWFRPLFNFFFMLIMFLIFIPIYPTYSINLGVLIYLCFSSLIVYTVLFSGWRRKSKYSFLGSLRGAAQIISYEIILLTLIFFPLIIKHRFNLQFRKFSFPFLWLIFLIIFFIWIITIVAETNRSPFDFAEGERELVSGFKTEYGGFLFALLFLGEYGNIIFVRFFSKFLFFSSWLIYWLVPFTIVLLFLVFRGTFPRFRYDLLMNLAWKIIFPFILFFFWVLLIILEKSVFAR